MFDKLLCRIGVFYDGSYFTYARRHFYFDRKLGWLDFKPFHSLIENSMFGPKNKAQRITVSYMGRGFKACLGLPMPKSGNSAQTETSTTI